MSARDYLSVALLIVLCCAALYLLLPGYTKYRETRTTVRQLRESLAVQDQEIQQLRRELNALRTDYRAIERVAREKFGWCRPEEQIYHFDGPAPRPSAAPDDEREGARPAVEHVESPAAAGP